MAAPRIVPRREWGAATTIGAGRAVPPGSRRFFVVHWPVMNDQDEATMVRAIERMHRGQGWAAAPGYNFLVGNRTGTIFEGCGRDIRGIHSPPHNTDGWGVCVLQPMNRDLSQAARNATRALYDWLCTVAGRQLAQWWHGRDYATACPGPQLIAWVRAGMPATGPPAPSPSPPPAPEEVELIASALAENGNFHVWVVGPQRRTIWLTHQAANDTAWWGGEAGRSVAGLRRFADAPQGRTFRGIAAERSRSGNLHLFATLDDGRTLYTWQRPGESDWSRPLQAFAPAP